MSDEDRLEDALDDLAAQGWDVTREGDRIVHIRGTFANPERIALTAAGLADVPVGTVDKFQGQEGAGRVEAAGFGDVDVRRCQRALASSSSA